MGKPPPGMIYKTTDSLEKNANEGCPMCLLCVEVLDPSYQKIPREIESDINARGQPVAAQYSRLSRGGIKTSSIQHEHIYHKEDSSEPKHVGFGVVSLDLSPAKRNTSNLSCFRL